MLTVTDISKTSGYAHYSSKMGNGSKIENREIGRRRINNHKSMVDRFLLYRWAKCKNQKFEAY